MSSRQVLLCSVLIALAGCGGDERSGLALAGAETSGVSARNQGLFLRTLPDACDYLPEALARELLQTDVARRPDAARRPTVTDGCSYSGPGGSGKHIGFRMFMWNLDMFDSANETREELREKAGYLADRQVPVAILDDVGNIAFAFDKDNGTTLVSLTGIGGTAVTSDRIVSELSISYFLSDPEQTYESRLGHIVALAKNHLERIRTLAGATDPYGPTP